MIRRCTRVIALLLVVLSPTETRAQARLGILVQELGRAQSQAIKGLGEELKRLGYQEKKNLFFETRNVKGNRAALQPAAGELGVTRMDLPFLLGTALSGDRTRAKVVGYGLHFLFGLLFALVYWLVFAFLDRAGWLFGLVGGLVHALFSGSVLVNILLPAVHPRMGTWFTAAPETPLLEPPGFMMLNYGRRTPVVALLAHMAYGAIVGAFIGGSR